MKTLKTGEIVLGKDLFTIAKAVMMSESKETSSISVDTATKGKWISEQDAKEFLKELKKAVTALDALVGICEHYEVKIEELLSNQQRRNEK